MQFDRLMASINRSQVLDRVGDVYDVMAGAQLQGKGIKQYVKALREEAGLGTAVKSETRQFLQDFGKGI